MNWLLVVLFSSHAMLFLRAGEFYEVIVDEGEGRINYQLIEIQSG